MDKKDLIREESARINCLYGPPELFMSKEEIDKEIELLLSEPMDLEKTKKKFNPKKNTSAKLYGPPRNLKSDKKDD